MRDMQIIYVEQSPCLKYLVMCKKLGKGKTRADYTHSPQISMIYWTGNFYVCIIYTGGLWR